MQFVDLQAQQRRIRADVERRLLGVLDHGQYALGPEVAELETVLAARCQVAEVVTCSSGTEALALVFRALSIGPGDAVVLPAYTFVASAGAVALVGATPVFADVDPVTFNLDVVSAARTLEAARAAGLRPRALLAVDLFGLPADAPALRSVAEDAGVELLIDGAQSVGGAIDGRPVGGFGRATTTSFFPAKPLGCYGDGGAIFTDDSDLADVLRSIRVHGQGVDKYDNIRLGTNGRLDTVQAAVLLAKLEVFDDELAERQRVADRYAAALPAAVTPPTVPAGRRSAWCSYTIRTPRRDAVVDHLAQSGIPTIVYYRRALHQQPVFRGALTDPEGLPVSEQLTTEAVSIPNHPYLGEEQGRVVAAIEQALSTP